MCKWAEWNGRIRGMKMHVVYHPGNDVPACVEITSATVNDVEIGRQTELEAGATYVFDKGYYHFGWWIKISTAKPSSYACQGKHALAQDKVPLRSQEEG